MVQMSCEQVLQYILSFLFECCLHRRVCFGGASSVVSADTWSMGTISCLASSPHILCISEQFSQTKFLHSLQYFTAGFFLHFSQFGSRDFARASQTWNRYSTWKSFGRSATPPSDSVVMFWQMGHVIIVFSLSSWTTSSSRQGDAQNTWKQGNSLGSLKQLEQIEHCNWSLIFFIFSSVTIGFAIIVTLLCLRLPVQCVCFYSSWILFLVYWLCIILQLFW